MINDIWCHPIREVSVPESKQARLLLWLLYQGTAATSRLFTHKFTTFSLFCILSLSYVIYPQIALSTYFATNFSSALPSFRCRPRLSNPKLPSHLPSTSMEAELVTKLSRSYKQHVQAPEAHAPRLHWSADVSSASQQPLT